MKFKLLLSLLVCGCTYVHSQTVKIFNGVVLSQLRTTTVEGVYDSYVCDYSCSLGIDYWKHKYFNLSSQIGYVTRGGLSDTEVWADSGIVSDNIVIKLRYVDFNTLFVGRIPINQFCIYAGVGPSVSFLLKRTSNLSGKYPEDNISNTPYNIQKGNIHNVGFGIRSELGLAYCLNRLEFGVSFSNLYDLVYLDASDYKIKSTIFMPMFSIGYILR